jgi:hypothetical protein
VNWGHLYISCSYPFFICFRCGERGHIKRLLETFLQINLCDTEDVDRILKAYKQRSSNVKKVNQAKLDTRHLDSSMLTKQQESYLIGRIGGKLEWEHFNIVSPLALVKKTNFMYLQSPLITKISQNKSWLTYICYNYVAFISLNRTVITLRHIKDQEPRYLQIYVEGYDGYDFYVAGYTDIYEFYKSPENYIVAEGVFDILNQRVSFNTSQEFTRIAVFGKSRLPKAPLFIQSFFKSPEIFYIYLDRDVLRDQFFISLLKFAYKNYTVRFFYNAAGKDMGDKLIKIKRR